MLSTFRRAKSSWIFGGIFGVVMVAFVITGVERRSPGMMPQSSDNDVASVGDESVTINAVDRIIRRQFEQMRQQQPDLDMARFLKAGAFDEIVTDMITSKAMTVFGQDHGLAVSPKMVDQEIVKLPQFQNAAGRFDQSTFRQQLQEARVTETELREDVATQIIQRQLLIPVIQNAGIPTQVAREYAALLLENRTGSVAIVPSKLVGPGRDPTDAEVAAYFQKNRAKYTIPEQRVVRYAVFGPEQVAAAAAPSDADVGAYYQQNAADYAATETRTLSQVVIPDQRTAEALAAKIKAGKSFAQAAAEAGFTAADTAIGDQTKEKLGRMSSPAVADAAFAAPKGGTTAPVKSPLGWHIMRVDAVNITPERTLAAVRGEIVGLLTKQRSANALDDFSGRLEDSIDDGASFEEAARQYSLQIVETPPVTAVGTAPDIPGYQAPADLGPLLKMAFDLSQEDPPVVQAIKRNERIALLTIGRIVPSAPPPLDKVKPRVKADLVDSLSLLRAKQAAEQIVAKVKRGEPIRQAASQTGFPLPPVQTLGAKRMQVMQAQGEIPAPLRMLFALPKGKAQILPAPKGAGYFVLHVDEVVPGNIDTAPTFIALMQKELNEFMAPEYGQQFRAAVEREVEVTRNPAAIAKLKGDLQKKSAAQ